MFLALTGEPVMSQAIPTCPYLDFIGRKDQPHLLGLATKMPPSQFNSWHIFRQPGDRQVPLLVATTLAGALGHRKLIVMLF